MVIYSQMTGEPKAAKHVAKLAPNRTRGTSILLPRPNREQGTWRRWRDEHPDPSDSAVLVSALLASDAGGNFRSGRAAVTRPRRSSFFGGLSPIFTSVLCIHLQHHRAGANSRRRFWPFQAQPISDYSSTTVYSAIVHYRLTPHPPTSPKPRTAPVVNANHRKLFKFL